MYFNKWKRIEFTRLLRANDEHELYRKKMVYTKNCAFQESEKESFQNWFLAMQQTKPTQSHSIWFMILRNP